MLGQPIEVVLPVLGVVERAIAAAVDEDQRLTLPGFEIARSNPLRVNVLGVLHRSRPPQLTGLVSDCMAAAVRSAAGSVAADPRAARSGANPAAVPSAAASAVAATGTR